MPIDAWVDPLTREGFAFSNPALSVLREFGGLTIIPPRAESNLFYPDDIVFNPLWASGDFERVRIWQAWRGTILSPIAHHRCSPGFLL